MAINDRTPNLNLALPNAANLLSDDVERLRSALGDLDTIVASKAGSAEMEAKADLVGGKVSVEQLPSYVDDVLEYANLPAMPATGEQGKIYVALETNETYRWSGSTYVALGKSYGPATSQQLGVVKVGSGLSVGGDGTLSVVGGGEGGTGLPAFDELIILPSVNGQTVLTPAGGYLAGQIELHLNGVLLYGNGDDYTASDGVIITLAAGVNTTDTLLLRRWKYLPEANAVNKTGDTMTGALNEAPLVSIVSGATTSIGTFNANTLSITGSATITSFGVAAAGVIRRVIFTGALTITHNAASLILPGGANISTSAGDVAVFLSTGSGWRCVSYLSARSAVGIYDRQISMAASNIDLSAGYLFTKTISGATTLTLSNVPTSGALASFSLLLTAGGSSVVTWWPNIKWQNNTPPVLSSTGQDILGFFSFDGGAKWYGFIRASGLTV